MASPVSTISIVGVGQGGNATNGGDVTLTFNVAPVIGDVVYVFGGHGTGTNTIGPSTAGYTALVSDTSTVCKFGVWRKVMGAAPDTTVVCQGGGSVLDAVAYCSFVLRGVDNTTPEDATTTTATGTSTNPNPPSITTVTNNAWVLALASSVVNDNSPGTITNYVNTVSANSTDTDPFTTAGATRLIASNGAEDPAAFSSWSTGVWFAASVAVRPAALNPGQFSGPTAIQKPIIPAPFWSATSLALNAGVVVVNYMPGVVTDWGNLPAPPFLQTFSSASRVLTTPTASPFVQSMWPTQVAQAFQQFWIGANNLPFTTLPFQNIWPRPAADRPNAAWAPVVNLSLTAIIASPFSQQRWPAPAVAQQAFASWVTTQNLPLVTASVVSYMPGCVTDWGPPALSVQRPVAPVTAAFNLPLMGGTTRQPFNQFSWPIPKDIPGQFWTPPINLPLLVPDYVGRDPLIVRKFQPEPLVGMLHTWFNNRLPITPVGVKPFLQNQWPAPTNPTPIAATWVAPFNQSLIVAAAVSYMPGAATNWGAPAAVTANSPSILGSRIQLLTAVAGTPFAQLNWLKAAAPVAVPAYWVARNNALLNTAPTIPSRTRGGGRPYPTSPLGPFIAGNLTLRLTPPVALPFVQSIWPRLADAVSARPFIAPAFNLPLITAAAVSYMPARAKDFGRPVSTFPSPQGNLGSSPQLLSAIVGTPVARYDWPNARPIAVTPPPLLGSSAQLLAAGAAAVPFAQYLWPTPRLLPAIPQVPLGASPQLLAVGAAAIPFAQYVWPAPTPISFLQAPSQGASIRLLGSTLPFNLYAWPNYAPPPALPQSGPLGSPLGLLQPVAAPFSQQVWPTIQPAIPAPSAVQGASIRLLTAPVATLPFNQYVWPVATVALAPNTYFVNLLLLNTVTPPIVVGEKSRALRQLERFGHHSPGLPGEHLGLASEAEQRRVAMLQERQVRLAVLAEIRVKIAEAQALKQRQEAQAKVVAKPAGKAKQVAVPSTPALDPLIEAQRIQLAKVVREEVARLRAQELKEANDLLRLEANLARINLERELLAEDDEDAVFLLTMMM